MVYNLAGQCVMTLIDEFVPAGSHTTSWSATTASGEQAAAGVYFILLEADSIREVAKVVLTK